MQNGTQSANIDNTEILTIEDEEETYRIRITRTRIKRSDITSRAARIVTRQQKSVWNDGVYRARKHYEEHGEYIGRKLLDKQMHETSKAYANANRNLSQQTLKVLDKSYSSFFSLLKKKQEGTYDGEINTPGYLPKNGRRTAVISDIKKIPNRKSIVIPMAVGCGIPQKDRSLILPPNVDPMRLSSIRIIPLAGEYDFTIEWIERLPKVDLLPYNGRAAAGDLGVGILLACVACDGKTQLIDGRPIKAENQWFNKRNAELGSIHSEYTTDRHFWSQAQHANARNRNDFVDNYLSMTARYIADWCLENDYRKFVLGWNSDFQRSSNMQNVNNQNFVNIPFSKLKTKLSSALEDVGIELVLQEESYTSKSSFWDKDPLPVHGEEGDEELKFSGYRSGRGRYRRKNGKGDCHADLNGAANTLRKSGVCDLGALYERGYWDDATIVDVARLGEKK